MSENSQDGPPQKRQKIEDMKLHPVEDEISECLAPTVDQQNDFSVDACEDGEEFVIDDKCSNFVTPEELEKLKEFKILDEVKSDDENSSNDSDESEDLSEDEIEKMLEQDLPEDFKAVPKPKEKPYVLRSKIILEEKGANPFEVLPLDWICVRHASGLPIYMHRPTRVVTFAKPYSLGKSNIQRHDIPVSAIPCLSYRKALEEEDKQNTIDKKIQEQVEKANLKLKKTNDNSEEKEILHEKAEIQPELKSENDGEQKDVKRCPFTGATGNISDCETKVDKENNSVSAPINEEECKIDVDVDIINKEPNQSVEDVDKFKSISVSESLVNKDETETEGDDKALPLYMQPVILPGGVAMPPPRVENVNTSWKTQHLTYEQINEYCKTLFKFKTVEVMHFRRWADRRKYTKARKALQYPTLLEGTKLITIPSSGQENGKGKRDWVMNMNGRCYLSVFHEYVYRALHKQPVYEFTQLENASNPYQATVYIGDMQYGVGYGSSKRQAKANAARASIQILIPEMNEELAAPNSDEPDFSFFDYVGIEDPRIGEFCAATCEPSPHAILRTCLLRNFGANDRHIAVEVKKLEYQKIQLIMKVGKHSASVVCKNKKAAKQRASQAILQSLHPHIRSWGSLLRLYGSRSIKSCKEKKLEEQQITLLQDKARRNEPNRAVLHKLRDEMCKLRQRDEAVVPIGTLMLTDHLPTHSGSNLTNVHL